MVCKRHSEPPGGGGPPRLFEALSAPSRLTSQPNQTSRRQWVGGKVLEFHLGSSFIGVFTFQKLIELYTVFPQK